MARYINIGAFIMQVSVIVWCVRSKSWLAFIGWFSAAMYNLGNILGGA